MDFSTQTILDKSFWTKIEAERQKGDSLWHYCCAPKPERSYFLCVCFFFLFFPSRKFTNFSFLFLISIGQKGRSCFFQKMFYCEWTPPPSPRLLSCPLSVVFLFVLLLVLVGHAAADAPSNALYELYTSTNGASWKATRSGWSSLMAAPTTFCNSAVSARYSTFYGIYCTLYTVCCGSCSCRTTNFMERCL